MQLLSVLGRGSGPLHQRDFIQNGKPGETRPTSRQTNDLPSALLHPQLTLEKKQTPLDSASSLDSRSPSQFENEDRPSITIIVRA